MSSSPRAIRARLLRPPNAVPDRGIDLGGKAVKAALAENKQRRIIEAIQFADEVKRGASNERKKVAK